MTRVWSCLPDSFPLVCGGGRWCAGQAANARLEPTRVDIGEHSGLAGCGAPGSTPVAGRGGLGSSARPLALRSQVRILPPPFLEVARSIPASPLTEPRFGSAGWSGADMSGHGFAGASRAVGSRSGGFRGSGALDVGGLAV
jgi:hypothetical protein